jgi:hypothetical protein
VLSSADALMRYGDMDGGTGRGRHEPGKSFGEVLTGWEQYGTIYYAT